ncbi:MAG: redoxin domain-containing protein [Nitrospinaceae bacterium]|nr:redoxin domain-containing protein [Nitrospinaceae bacterium]
MDNNFFGNLFSPKKTSGKETTSSSLPVLYPAPEFRGLENWINTPPIASMRQLLGKVVLIDFWTYSCLNCLNAMPYVKNWHKKYKGHGLVVLGIHAPEFGFEKKYQNVLQAVKKHQIKFPVAQDNGFRLWRAYKNRYWPALYLIDRQGRVRYMHFGEGRYQVTESAIRQLLKNS